MVYMDSRVSQGLRDYNIGCKVDEKIEGDF